VGISEFLIQKYLTGERAMSKTTQAGKVEEQAKAINNLNKVLQNKEQIIEALQRMVTDSRLKEDAAISSYEAIIRSQSNVLKELYKAVPEHGIFKANPGMTEQVIKQLEIERQAAEQAALAKAEEGRKGPATGLGLIKND
jgi:hypothetical protein